MMQPKTITVPSTVSFDDLNPLSGFESPGQKITKEKEINQSRINQRSTYDTPDSNQTIAQFRDS